MGKPAVSEVAPHLWQGQDVLAKKGYPCPAGVSPVRHLDLSQGHGIVLAVYLGATGAGGVEEVDLLGFLTL